MAKIRHLENRHDVIFSAMGGPIWIKFLRLVQNDMPTAVMWSKAKPEVELQLRTFGFRNRKSQPRTIVITMKFDLLTETDIRKRAMSPDLKPEVKLRRSDRHLENRHNIISPLRIYPFRRNSVA